jgi:hypothetical protein
MLQPHLRLPIDLYRFIIEYISDQRDLCSLCVVSKAFRQESERVLYRNVRLTNNYACLVSWSQAIINTPWLASLVHTLSLPSLTRYHDGLYVSFLVQSMAKALRALTKLKALHIVNNSSAGLFQCYLHPTILRGCKFRLETFGIRSGSLSLPDLVPFLSEQREITYWKYENRTLEGIHILADDPSILPRLSCIYLQDWWILPHLFPRPITRLCLHVTLNESAFARLMDALSLFKETLTHLSLNVLDPFSSGVSRSSHPLLVRLLWRVKELLPRLQFLNLDGEAAYVSTIK